MRHLSTYLQDRATGAYGTVPLEGPGVCLLESSLGRRGVTDLTAATVAMVPSSWGGEHRDERDLRTWQRGDRSCSQQRYRQDSYSGGAYGDAVTRRRRYDRVHGTATLISADRPTFSVAGDGTAADAYRC